MLEKVAKIIGKMNSTVILAVGLGIVAVVFIVGLILSIGGDLAKFKSAAKLAISKPTPSTLNESAKKMPVYVRKLYKKAKQTGEKPSDVIGINECVYNPFAASAAAKFPAAVMAAGVLSILFTFFAAWYVKDFFKVGGFIYIIPLLVTVVVMVLRLLAGVIASCVKKSAVGVYNKYVDMLDKNLHGASASHVQEEEEPVVQAAAVEEDEPAVVVAQEGEDESPVSSVHTFSGVDEPDSIAVELADEEPHAEPVVEPQTVVMQPAGESEEDIRARARAEALAAARAAQAAAAEQEKARAEAAARAQAAAQAAARAQAAQAQTATANGGSSSADEVIARIEKISQEGASLSTMKEVALELQKERAKPENKTPETQRRLNEALATLLKAMSGANKK